ncbi:MAG: ferrous iron transport protein B, partial [Eubacteriales bacterium]|nr:ferrous iron transport protein B [Eubacteriales bacterium]
MDKKNITIALAGNPNSGKTTLFNALTGSNQYVGNWPGVTVEKKEGQYKKDNSITITDLPGIYSLSPYTLEEVIAREYLLEENPDVILDIVDGTNLERNLYLTTQFMELGIPVVVAINMMDVVEKNGDKIDIDELSRKLKCKVVPISALKGDSVFDAAQIAIEEAKKGRNVPQHMFSGEVEHALAHIEEACVHGMDDDRQRFYAVKLFERDEKVHKKLNISDETIKHIEKDIVHVEEHFDDDSEAIITNERYEYIEKLMKTAYIKKSQNKLTLSEKIDKVVTNRILALPIFALVMWGVYTLSIGTIGDWTVGFMNDTLFGEWIIPSLTGFLENVGCATWLNSLICDGIVGGVGAVLGFVPQMFILFFLLSILENIGYMARIAFIMDRVFRKLGLSGKSFIPMLVASGCGVPGIMASRTIEQDRDRKMTIMTTGFIPCGAKMPIVGLIAGALFGGAAWVATLAYFIGIGAVIISGIMLKKTKAFAGDPAPFVMELPSYHMPVASNVLRATWERGWSFVKRAGTVILAASVIIWVLNSLSFEGGFHYITEENGGASILENIGSVIAWLFYPLGFGNWQAAVATILGLVAKEEVVGVFGSLSKMLASSNPEAAADLLGAMEGNVQNLSLIG